MNIYIRQINLKLFVIIYLMAFTSVLFPQESYRQTGEQNGSYNFYYEDIYNFKELLNKLKNEADTLTAINTYFEKGSNGMKAWLKRYKVKPSQIKAALRYFPKYYEYLSKLEAELKKLEPKITLGLDGLKKLYPSSFIHVPPIYYFILFAGRGSVEMTATMISIDYFGHSDALEIEEFDRIGGLFPKGKLPLVSVDLVPQVVVHETAHLFQSYIQGKFNYESIYEDKNRTIGAYLIREGGADFLTFLAAELKDNTKFIYGDKNERELWEHIKPLLNDDPNLHPGLFSGKSKEHSDWPFQIGYYVGFKIVEHYYNQAHDKQKAIIEILSSYTEEDFYKFINTYDYKWK